MKILSKAESNSIELMKKLIRRDMLLSISIHRILGDLN